MLLGLVGTRDQVDSSVVIPSVFPPPPLILAMEGVVLERRDSRG